MFKELNSIISFQKIKNKNPKPKKNKNNIENVENNSITIITIPNVYQKNIDIQSDKIDFTNDIHTFILYKEKILKKIKDNNNSLSMIEMQNEVSYYKYIQSTKKTQYSSLFPILYGLYETGILMEYKYPSLFDSIFPLHLINKEEFSIDILNNIFHKLSILHQDKIQISQSIFFYDIKLEIFDHIQFIIKHYIKTDTIIKSINNINLISVNDILKKCKNWILQYYSTIENYEYSLIHGNLIMSHILINNHNLFDISFISPRGHFGNTKNYGIREFDISKILFSLQGYDTLFYSNNPSFDIHNQNIHLPIHTFTSYEMYEKYFHKIHQIWSVIHWFHSISNFPKDSTKAILCYYYGLYFGSLI